jgi:hypothetical protein
VTLLSHLPCLWIAPDPAPLTALYRMNRYLPDYFRVSPDDTKAMTLFLGKEKADHILVVQGDVLPYGSLPLYVPDPLLMASELSFRLLVRNSVTERVDDRHGPIVCRRDSLLADLTIPRPDAVVPVVVGDWHCNSTAEAAFAAGFDTALALPLHEATLAASLGADAPHGLAWSLGALSALGRSGDCATAWAREEPRLEDPVAARRRIGAVARLLRVDRGIDVQPLGPEESRLVKSIAGDWPPARMFQSIADAYDRLGPAGQINAERYRTAAFYIWGQDSADQPR